MTYKEVNPKIIEDFDEWNKEKQEIHFKESQKQKFINPREIWYIKMGINIGSEQNGKKQFRRPVLVLKRIGNMYICVPLTTKGKPEKFYLKLNKINFLKDFKEESWIIISQIRSYDKKRFLDFLGKVDTNEFYEIKKILSNTYF